MTCLGHAWTRLSTRPGTIDQLNDGRVENLFPDDLTILRPFVTPTESVMWKAIRCFGLVSRSGILPERSLPGQ